MSTTTARLNPNNSSAYRLQKMPLLTIFTTPKPFTDQHIAMIQRNAILSWLYLGPEVEVLLVGDEPGMLELSTEYGIRHITQVERNSQGTPLVNSIFALARDTSNSPYLVYANADMILLPDIVRATRDVSNQAANFLVIGQRWDLDIKNHLDFSDSWAEQITEDVKLRGHLHPPAGSDYFIFPRGLFQRMPGFAIGRAGWDNWMIYEARRQGFAVVDGTPSILAVHQDHDYRHLPGSQPHYNLPESNENQKLAGGLAHLYMLLDSNKQLRRGKLRTPRPTLLRLIRRGEVLLMPAGGSRKSLRWSFARQFRRLRRRISGSL